MARKKDATEREVDELLDSLLEGRSPEEIMGRGGLLDALTKRVVERALEGELTDHLGYEKHAREGRNGGNLALALTLEGNKELLGLWVGEAEGAKFWLSVLTELKNRGVEDILIAAIDGLKGFPEAIESVLPKTRVQLCIVHLVRGSLRFVAWKQRKAVARDLRTIYRAASLEAAEP